MTKHALFFNSHRSDRVYNSESFRTWLRKFFTNGVNSEGFIPTVGTTQLTSEVTGGFIHINGATKYVSATTFVHSAAAGSGTQANNPRYDMIVAEYNENESVRDIVVKVVEGQYTGDPSTSIPAPVRSGGIYQVPIAVFKIGTSGGTFDPNTIELYLDYHTASGSEYGADNMFIRSTIINKTDAQIAAEFTTYYALFSPAIEASFDAWFAAMVSTLSTAKAGEVKNNIDRLNGLVTTQVDAEQTVIDTTEGRIDGKLDALEAQASGSMTKYNASYLSTGGPTAAEATGHSYVYRHYRSQLISGLGAGQCYPSDIKTRYAEMYTPYEGEPTQYRECGMAYGTLYSGTFSVDMQIGHQKAYNAFGTSIRGSVVERRIVYTNKSTQSGYTSADTIASQSASALSDYYYSDYSSVGSENTDASLDIYVYR